MSAGLNVLSLGPRQHDVLDTLVHAQRPLTLSEIEDDTGADRRACSDALSRLDRRQMARCCALHLTIGKTEKCFQATDQGREAVKQLEALDYHPGV